MSKHWEDISDSVVSFELNGKKFKATVDIAVTDDDSEIDMDFESPEDERDTMERFRNGSLINVCIRVTARWNGVEGTDYLGACYLEPGSENIEQCVADHGMIDVAIESLKAELVTRLAQLKELVGGA